MDGVLAFLRWNPTVSYAVSESGLNAIMPRRPHRNYATVFKAKVALAAIKDDKTVAESWAGPTVFDVHAIRSRSGRYSCWSG